MKKAVAYLRVSTDGQVERYGFDRQLNEINNYAEVNGIEVVGVFREEGVSGATELKTRVEFGKLLNYLDGHPEVNCVIISELSRLARDLMIQENMIRDFQRKGIELISVKEPDLDKNDPTRKLIRRIFGIVNEYEREIIALRMKAGRIAKAKKGEHVVGRIPTGFKSVVKGNKKVLEKVEEEIEVVRLIFELKDDKKMSYRKIAEHLNELGHKPKYAKKYNHTTVYKIYNNPKYRGLVKYSEDGQTITTESNVFKIV